MSKHRKSRFRDRKNRRAERFDERGEQTNVHHRRSRNTGGRDTPDNRSRVSVREHHAYNVMFNDGHMHPRDIADKLTRIWISPDYEIVARRKGGQCYRPCGVENGGVCSEEQLSVATAERSSASESMSSHRQGCEMQFDIGRFMSLMESALDVAKTALRKTDSCR